MSGDKDSQFVIDVIELEDFLRNPPDDFTVEVRGTGYRFVKYDSHSCCVFIDEIKSAKGKVIFQDSPGREIKIHTLRDYMHVRRSLTSQRICVLVSAYEDNSAWSKKAEKAAKVLQQYIVVINGSNPVIKWEIERGLDQTISSVAGESYTVDIDLSEVLQNWMGDNFHILVDGRKVKPFWKDTSFVLNYHSDSLFDFPYWLGFSKRQFKICGR
ncbi:mesenteric estrogen-dependent adipogenesis protein-like [Megalops cyprinoides]|uniref:mesenteric estrogen-dependent adipogenesis protein-like n=1 Tax=Megalops cyprinoides TaxID=118141 RepID=UPI001864CF2A|nr:mesenteric estrogen-dependent adipogenesis protein-like [Megalops cyprinoides]